MSNIFCSASKTCAAVSTPVISTLSQDIQVLAHTGMRPQLSQIKLDKQNQYDDTHSCQNLMYISAKMKMEPILCNSFISTNLDAFQSQQNYLIVIISSCIAVRHEAASIQVSTPFNGILGGS